MQAWVCGSEGVSFARKSLRSQGEDSEVTSQRSRVCQGSVPQGSEQTCRRQVECVPLKVKAGRRRPTYLGSSGGHRGGGGGWGRQGAAGEVKGHIVLMATQDAGEVHSKGQQCSWIGGRLQPSGHLQERGCRGDHHSPAFRLHGSQDAIFCLHIPHHGSHDAISHPPCLPSCTPTCL